MHVIIEKKLSSCGECPNQQYEGTSWGEDLYMCCADSGNFEISNLTEIDIHCPFIKKTLEKLNNMNNQI